MHSSLRFKLIIPFSLLLIVGSFTLIGRLATHAAGTSFKLSTKSGVASTALLSQCGAWSVVPSPNVGTSHNYLNAVAAVTPSNVWAVGYYVGSSGDPYQTLIERWNGTIWNTLPSQNPSNGGGNFLYGVDVISASNVWAVGNYKNTSTGAFQTLIEQWNSTNWDHRSQPECRNR